MRPWFGAVLRIAPYHELTCRSSIDLPGRPGCVSKALPADALLLLHRRHPRPRPSPDTILVNGKIVVYDARACAGAGGARRKNRRRRQFGGHPRARRSRHPRHRSRRPHRHPRPDQFPHPRHPRRAFLHNRGALDRRPHAGRGARPHPRRGASARRRARGSSSPAAGPSGSSWRTAGRRKARSPPQRRTITSTSSSSTAACCSTPAATRRWASGAILTSPRASPPSSDKDGRPTGWLTGDNRAISDLFDLLPRPTYAQKVDGTRAFFRALNAVGVTGVIDPGGYNLSIPDYQPLFQVWRERELTVRVRYSLSAPRRGHELEDFKELTQMLPMGFGDDWLRFNGIGENVTWGMYNNDTPTDAQKEQLCRGAALGGLAQHDRDLPLAQRPRGASSARRAGARQRRDAGRRTALVDRASQRCVAGKPQAHEGDGARLADAERVLFPRRGVSRPARPRTGARLAADRDRA